MAREMAKTNTYGTFAEMKGKGTITIIGATETDSVTVEEKDGTTKVFVLMRFPK